ncbi:3-phosphoshikimate 1-carboxyvinyltransferase, partial [Halobacteriales archaeon QS_9_70_65]
GIDGDAVSVRGDVSSQYVTALLMAGAVTDRGVEMELTTDLKSAPYVDVTLELLADFGVDAEAVGGDDSGVAAGADGFRVAGGQSYAPDGGDYVVPGDFSSTSYLLAVGALAADDGLVVEGVRPSAQGDAVVVDVLGRMGADVAWNREAGRVRVAASSLEGVEVGVADTPDLLPTIAVLGAAADGTTRITDCEHVRLKETDRVAAMAAELERMGVDVEERTDELVVDGGGLEGATVSGHADHRIVMALSVAGVVADGETTVVGADHVDVSFPAFFETLSALGAAVERPS